MQLIQQLFGALPVQYPTPRRPVASLFYCSSGSSSIVACSFDAGNHGPCISPRHPSARAFTKMGDLLSEAARCSLLTTQNRGPDAFGSRGNQHDTNMRHGQTALSTCQLRIIIPQCRLVLTCNNKFSNARITHWFIRFMAVETTPMTIPCAFIEGDLSCSFPNHSTATCVISSAPFPHVSFKVVAVKGNQQKKKKKKKKKKKHFGGSIV